MDTESVTNHSGPDGAALRAALDAAVGALRAVSAALAPEAEEQDARSPTAPATAGAFTVVEGVEALASSPCSPPPTIAGVEQWLASRDVSLRHYRGAEAADVPLDRIAADIGDRHPLVVLLLREARRAAAVDRSRTVHLRDEPADVVCATTALATRLHDLGLLSFARYERATRQLHLRVAEAGTAFLTGGWLERWAAGRGNAALARTGQCGVVVRNLEVELSDGQATELDCLLMADGVEPVWVECRTGAYQHRLDRDSRLRRTLGLDQVRAIILLAEMSDVGCAELSAIHGLHVTGIEGLDEALATTLAAGAPQLARAEAEHEDAAPVPDEVSAPSLPAIVAPPTIRATAGAPVAFPRDVEQIHDHLRRCHLRPHSALRRSALESIAASVGEGLKEVRELRVVVAERSGLSRAGVSDLLLALAHGGALRDEQGAPLSVLGGRPIGLASTDPGELEAACRRAWRSALRAVDPTLLTTAGGERAFAAGVDADDR